MGNYCGSKTVVLNKAWSEELNELEEIKNAWQETAEDAEDDGRPEDWLWSKYNKGEQNEQEQKMVSMFEEFCKKHLDLGNVQAHIQMVDD